MMSAAVRSVVLGALSRLPSLDFDFVNGRGFNSIDRAKLTPDSILTYTSPSPKMVYGNDGVLRYAPHNLFLNSGAPATQNVTLITGFSYTVTVTGSGSLAGSSGASGTASAGSPATFVATGTTGTFTLTGSLTTIQINRAPAHAGYIPTTTAAVYALPIDHNPTTFAPLGVLIEEQRTNLLTYSEQFDNAAWLKSNITITANAATAPDGTITADLLLDTAVAGTHVAIQTISKAASSIFYSSSVYVKANVRDIVEFRVSDQTGNGVRAVFNLTTATITTAATAYGAGFTVSSSSITNVGNGWYRIQLGVNSNTATAIGQEIYVADASGNISYTGNGSGLYIWGAQLEAVAAGAFPTSYIPTVDSQATRLVDNVSILTSAFGYNATEGTLYTEGAVTAAGGAYFACFSDNSDVEYMGNRKSGAYSAIVVDGGVTQATMTGGTYVAGAEVEIAFAYKANDCAVSIDGAAVSTDASVTLPTVTNLYVGAQRSARGVANGPIKRLTYFPTRRSNADLQVLTT